MNRFLTLILMGTLASFALVGCDDDKKPGGGNTPDASDDGDVPDSDVPDAEIPVETGVRVMHAASAFGAVDVFANDSFAAPVEGLTDLEYSTTALTKKLLEPGDYDLAIAASDSTDPENEVLASRNGLGLAEGQFALVIAYGDDAEGGVGIAAYTDFGMTPGADEAVVRVFHGSETAGEVDILLVGEEVSSALISDFTPGEVQELAIPAATALTVGADVNNDGSADVTFDIPAALQAGAKATAVVVNDNGVYKLLINIDGTDTVLAISMNEVV
jgi:hypothetical protein